MDDVAPPNLERLKAKAEELIAAHREELDALCEQLGARRRG